MSLSLDVLKHNADLLFNDLVHISSYHPSHIVMSDKNRNLTVDSEGRLSTIGRYNFIGRLIKWLSNLDGFVDKQVNEITLQTLRDIDQHNLRHNGKIREMIYLTRRTSDDEYFNNSAFLFDGARAYSSYYPAYYLGERILTCSRFQTNPEFKEAIEAIKKNNYPHAPESYRTALKDSRVWNWESVDLFE